MRRHAFVLATIALATLAACADHGAAGPTAPLARGAATPAPGDSSHYFAGEFTAHGHILGVVGTAPTPGSNDTLRFEPLAGSRIRVVRNLLVNGVATQELAAETVSDDDGAYAVSGLAAGYYIVQADPPSGSPYAGGFSYLPGQSSDVQVDVYLWKQP